MRTLRFAPKIANIKKNDSNNAFKHFIDWFLVILSDQYLVHTVNVQIFINTIIRGLNFGGN